MLNYTTTLALHQQSAHSAAGFALKSDRHGTSPPGLFSGIRPTRANHWIVHTAAIRYVPNSVESNKKGQMTAPGPNRTATLKRSATEDALVARPTRARSKTAGRRQWGYQEQAGSLILALPIKRSDVAACDGSGDCWFGCC